MTTPAELHRLLDDVLEAVVAVITDGATNRPRPGQHALAHDILGTMVGKDRRPGQMLGCAPTGVGKAVACAVPAALMAAQQGDRTLISTESLALQAQLLEKDLPDVARAVLAVTGGEVSFAVLKGWANFVCPVAALGSLDQMTGTESDLDRAGVLEAALDIVQGLSGPRARLIEWALAEAVFEAPGDKASCGLDVTAWPAVSTSAAECLDSNDKPCPLLDSCPAARARREVALADIVVTNHALPAIQAARDAPIVLSNGRYGEFDHLVVDEAHALPDKVRNAGAVAVSGRSVRSAARLLGRLFGSKNGIEIPDVDAAVERGFVLADRVDRALTTLVNEAKDPVPVTADDALGDLPSDYARWRSEVARTMPATTIPTIVMAMAKVGRAIDDVHAAIEEFSDPSEAAARWVEPGHLTDDERVRGWSGAVARVSPVDVAGPISRNLFTTRTSRDDPPSPISVSMVSATMPPGFGFAVGIPRSVTLYPSPFDAAYAASMLYVPRVIDPADLDQVARANGNRWRFDVWRHPDWAKHQMRRLVDANAGAALVLATTAANGKRYAEHLRATTDLTVHSQWDGGDVGRIAATWKADRDSVLVGTTSLMTGLDAAGDTCTLVVLDRVLRVPNNVVDDARVADAAARMGMDKWSADRFIYGGDAATRMRQAAGRLIRRTSDTGMVACLDPRLMARAPLSYPEPTRQALIGAFSAFPNRTGDLDEAIAWLRDHATARVAAG